MIDLESEELVCLADAAAFFPRRRGGKRPSFTTIWRWVTAGVNGIKLEAIRCGSTLCTTRPAVVRFLEAQTQADRRISPASASSTSAARRKQIERAEAELAREGF